MEGYPTGLELPGTGNSLDQEQDRITRSEVWLVHFLKQTPNLWVRGWGLANRKHTNRYMRSIPSGHEESLVFGSSTPTKKAIPTKSRNPILGEKRTYVVEPK